MKQVEDEESAGEAEDPMMLQRDAKDWKVSFCRKSGRILVDRATYGLVSIMLTHTYVSRK